MRIGDMTVMESAIVYAREHGMTLVVADTGLDAGVEIIDPVEQTLTVHPDAATVTLDMNTRGPLLPGAYAAQPTR
jgi:phosphohistidine swiveling domain-containing protein